MTFTVAHTGQDGGPARLHLTGELDMGSAPELNAVIDRLAADGVREFLVDLTELTFCDSTGIAVFVRGDNHASAAGGWLRVTGASGRVARVLQVTGLAEVLEYDPRMSDPRSQPTP